MPGSCFTEVCLRIASDTEGLTSSPQAFLTRSDELAALKMLIAALRSALASCPTQAEL